MTDDLKEKCELFEQNRSAIKGKFMFEKDIMSIAAGLLFTGAGRSVDIEKLTQCKEILSKNTSFFSDFRGTVELALLGEMALAADPEQYISDVKAVCQRLHAGKLKKDLYLILSAMMICDLGKQENVEEIIEKHHEIIKQMEKQHPFITTAEDSSYVILLALTDREASSILDDMTTGEDYLKNDLKCKVGSDAKQGLIELLALTDGDIKGKCDKAIGLYEALKAKKTHVGEGYAFIALGTLTGIEETEEILADQIIETDQYLKGLKAFQGKSVEDTHRLMTAEILVAESYGMGASLIGNTFINSALGIIKANQIAAMISLIANVLPPVLSALADMDLDSITQDTQGDKGGTASN